MILCGNKLIDKIKEVIYSQHFLDKHKINSKFFTRRRKLEFATVVATILKLAKKSLQLECEFLEPNVHKLPPSKQAFSKARYKFSHTGFEELLKISLQESFEQNPTLGQWKGYRFVGADGSSLRLPKSEEVERYFGKFKCNGENTNNNPILGRVSMFVDLCTGLILDARLKGWNVGEQSMAHEQLPLLTKELRGYNQKNICFIYDRGYVSKQFIKLHKDLMIDFILRLPSKCYLGIWELVKAGETDFYFTIGDISTRVIVITLPNSAKEVLVTSLNRECFSIVDIGKLYHLRWNLEENYKKLKINSEIENFCGFNLEAVLQEFWAHLVMSNILTTFILDHEAPLNPDNLPKYKLNFSILLGATRHKLKQFLLGECDGIEFITLFNRVVKRAKQKVKYGRQFSRFHAGKPKHHHVFRRIC